MMVRSWNPSFNLVPSIMNYVDGLATHWVLKFSIFGFIMVEALWPGPEIFTLDWKLCSYKWASWYHKCDSNVCLQALNLWHSTEVQLGL